MPYIWTMNNAQKDTLNAAAAMFGPFPAVAAALVAVVGAFHDLGGLDMTAAQLECLGASFPLLIAASIFLAKKVA